MCWNWWQVSAHFISSNCGSTQKEIKSTIAAFLLIFLHLEPNLLLSVLSFSIYACRIICNWSVWNHSAERQRCFVNRKGFYCCKQSLSVMRWKLCCSDLSLCCDPDRQGAIVPPLIHKLSLVVGLLHRGGCVEPHVVDYPVVLDVTPCRRESPSALPPLATHSVTHLH